MTASLISDLTMPPGYYLGAKGAWCTLPWPTTMDEKLDLIAHSLGPAVIDWAEWRTGEPGLLNDDGAPWRFTPGQARFLILWYAFNDQGRFIYRRGCKRGSKGSGKDPLAAAMCNIELLGPSQLHWDGARYVGKQHTMPLVQIASNSEEQSKDVLRVANSQFGAEATNYYGLDKGRTATFVKTSPARIEVLTASERSSEGDPATFIVLNETHHMTQRSGGHAVAKVARRNVGKSKRNIQARMVDFTNAHQRGQDSIGEKTFEAWQKQQSGKYPQLKKDILYDSIEFDPKLDIYDPQQRMLALQQASNASPTRWWTPNSRPVTLSAST